MPSTGKDAAGLSLDEAILIGVLSGNVVYGAFVVFFFTCLYVLFRKRKTARPNWVLVGVTISMFVLSTIIEALEWSRILDAFIVYRDTIGPLAYFANISSWKEVTKTGLLCVYLLLADGALVYRCWIVWSKRFIVIAFPLLLFIADIGVVIAVIVTMAKTEGTSLFAHEIARWTVAVISFTLAQNIIVISLIIYRILKVHRATEQHRVGTAASLTAIIPVIVESGLLYVTALFIFLVLYVVQSNAMRIMYDLANGIIGLAFTMMIVRIGLGLTPGQVQASSGTKFSSSHPSSMGATVAMQPISVNVNRSVEMKRGFGGRSNSEFDLNQDQDQDKGVRVERERERDEESMV